MVMEAVSTEVVSTEVAAIMQAAAEITIQTMEQDLVVEVKME